jgi:NAD(P)H-dependent flavin oxidoreductase YrpB (nitropropane dioxygenase family)
MPRTALTELLAIEHPIVSAGMGGGMADGELAGAVAEAGGLGVVGASWLPPDEARGLIRRARELTEKPIGVNLLLFGTEDLLEPVLDEKPEVLSTAWARENQDLTAIFAAAHERGAKVMHMVQTAAGAEAAAEAGADVIVAQGTEGGGHVGLIGTSVVVRQVVRAVTPLPVVAAGGLVDGAGLVAALALGAQGVLLGTRFVATDECPAPDYYKQAIVESDGADTVVTTMSDALTGRDWPGAWARIARTAFAEEWLGRDPEVRRRREELFAQLSESDERGDAEQSIIWLGQSAGLIDTVMPAGEVVRAIAAEAEEILASMLS